MCTLLSALILFGFGCPVLYCNTTVLCLGCSPASVRECQDVIWRWLMVRILSVIKKRRSHVLFNIVIAMAFMIYMIYMILELFHRGRLKRSARAVRAQCNYLGVWP